jgi:hypothetical protein
MAKSAHALAVDQLQAALRPFFKENSFRVRGRTFNRLTEDGLTQVVYIQMGPSDPPGTTYIPGFRENLHGLFTVNLGIYVPEVAELFPGHEAKSWVQEYHCCIRTRLSETCKEDDGIWWHASQDDAVINDVCSCLQFAGLPFLDRYSTRDKIICEWSDRSTNMGASAPPRIVLAIILAARGERLRARKLLARQVSETDHAGHRNYVRDLAEKLHLGDLGD